MIRCKTANRRKIIVLSAGVFLCLFGLIGRLVYLMIFRSEYYTKLATDLQQREREIKAARGRILDVNGVVLADNTSVCTISVVHNQIEDVDAVVEALSLELGMDEETIRAKVEKVSALERIKSNVDKETGNRILSYGLSGIKVDEDYRRTYPYGTLASKLLGFTGSDNQGILGIEVIYEDYLLGTNGRILTTTDARGIEVANAPEERVEPVDGYDLYLSLDYNIQEFCTQEAEKVYLQKEADGVSIIVMNPQNGELLAMVDYPEYDLNDPYTLIENYAEYAGTDEEQDYLNQMWRNSIINDTYEPGSIFKIVTTSAALEEGVVTLEDTFYCPGYITVEDRRIRCHKTAGHGSETFVEALQNSCNPVFIEVGARLGANTFYQYFEQFGLLSKTGIDLPGEASTIMHDPDNIGPVELATISFGQSFQVTALQMATTVASLINGGVRVTPHLGLKVTDAEGNTVEEFVYDAGERIVSEETSATLCTLLESVVSEGGGINAYIEEYEIGGKTATSQTLPRSENRYISYLIG